MGKVKEMLSQIEEKWDEMLFQYHMQGKKRKKKVIYKKKIKGANHGNGRIRNKASK